MTNGSAGLEHLSHLYPDLDLHILHLSRLSLLVVSLSSSGTKEWLPERDRLESINTLWFPKTEFMKYFYISDPYV